MRPFLVLDIATAPIVDAATYLDGAITAPSNYKDPQKIADYITEKQAERLSTAALDIDLARISGIGMCSPIAEPDALLFQDDEAEVMGLIMLAGLIRDMSPTIVTYGGFNFDLPVLQRRAKYLDVNFPAINLDRYKSPHVDLCELLSDRNPQRRRPLGFYVRRLGWRDITKALSGAEEGQVFQTGKWDELKASILHDVTATKRLAEWLGVIHAPEAISA